MLLLLLPEVCRGLTESAQYTPTLSVTSDEQQSKFLAFVSIWPVPICPESLSSAEQVAVY